MHENLIDQLNFPQDLVVLKQRPPRLQPRFEEIGVEEMPDGMFGTLVEAIGFLEIQKRAGNESAYVPIKFASNDGEVGCMVVIRGSQNHNGLAYHSVL